MPPSCLLKKEEEENKMENEKEKKEKNKKDEHRYKIIDKIIVNPKDYKDKIVSESSRNFPQLLHRLSSILERHSSESRSG